MIKFLHNLKFHGEEIKYDLGKQRLHRMNPKINNKVIIIMNSESKLNLIFLDYSIFMILSFFAYLVFCFYFDSLLVFFNFPSKLFLLIVKTNIFYPSLTFEFLVACTFSVDFLHYLCILITLRFFIFYKNFNLKGT